MNIIFRGATTDDAPAMHRLIAGNLEVGHLLPRTLEDLVLHAERFIVADDHGSVIGCAELAPLSSQVAEVRSLVVDEDARGRGIGGRLVNELSAIGASRGFATLCAFTHEPTHFVRMGFSMVPHTWVPEKIAHDCLSCPLFRRCGQYAVTLPLREGAHIGPLPSAAVIYNAKTAGRRPNIERLQLDPAVPA
jgi:amino-acid N-acetyltransferase